MNRFALVFGMVGIVAGILGATLLSGCHTVPTADTVYLVGHGCGATTGIVSDSAVKDPAVREATISLAKRISQVVPQVGQTIEEAWGETAREHTEQLVQKGKLTPAQGQLVLAGFKLICVGYTALEDRYPNIRTYRDLANAGLSGFFDGFLSTFKEECEDCCDECSDCTIDRYTYRKLKAVQP